LLLVYKSNTVAYTGSTETGREFYYIPTNSTTPPDKIKEKRNAKKLQKGIKNTEGTEKQK
jgi:hypothetical protein